MMRIGVPKEIKDKESRVAITPAGVLRLTQAGHQLYVEQNAGIGSGFSNQDYLTAGASLVSAAVAWNTELVVKVKEPLPPEYQYLAEQIVFTFFHLAGITPELTEVLLTKGTTALAYETLENEQGNLPILAPMSAIAGNMAALMGAYYLASPYHGKGIQLGTVLGKHYGKVLILGDGVVGQHAAGVAIAMGAEVYLAGLKSQAPQQLATVNYIQSNVENINQHLKDTDLLIGAVLCRGEKAPYLVSEQQLKTMAKGSVVVDVSIDQGGCIETSKPTSHSKPIFIQEDIVHYCVTNMPAAYPKTATIALSRVSLAYIEQLANHGLEYFIKQAGVKKSLNTYQGFITCQAVADALHKENNYHSIKSCQF